MSKSNNMIDGKKKINKALSKVKEDLRNNLMDSNLYYRMGDIYASIGEYNIAYLCYEQALYLCKEDERRGCITEIMNNLKNSYDLSVNPVSFIILTFNNLEYTQKCIDSIRNNVSRHTYEIIVVDNNSTDGTVKWLREQKDIRCILS